MAREISNTEDIIDSRDVIERIAELTEQDDRTPEEHAELRALVNLTEKANGTPDWTYGEALIRESYFEDYARQLAEDIGAISGNEQWPLSCIDWEKAARELSMDYSTVDFDGIDYMIRM